MCRLPELPALAEKRIQTITVKGAVSTLLRPEDRETETDPDTGEETVTVTWSTGGEDVTGNADTASLLAEVEALLHQVRGLQALGRGGLHLRL